MTTFLALTLVGLVVGCIYALTACGLVVTYTTSGVFNFAHGAIGMLAAFTYWQFSVDWGLPAPLALALVLLVLAPVLGAVVERFLVRPLYGAPIGVTLVVTLGLLITLLGVANVAWPPTGSTRVLPKFFEGQTLTVFSLVISYNELLVIAMAGAVAVGLRSFFSRTRTGIAMRAVVDDPELAALAGTNPERVSQLSWALGASLASLAGILLAPLVTLDILGLTLLVINGYAAAMVGRLRSLPLTVAGALTIGLLSSLTLGYAPSGFVNNVKPALPMFVLFAAVLFLKQERVRTGSLAGVRLPRTPSRREASAGGGLFLAGVWLVSGQLGAGDLATLGRGLVLGFIILSLVVLAGFGGQVSLCQLTFVGLGAFAMGKLGGGLVGLAGAVALPAFAGALVALTVVRLRGLYLALATLAFAQAMDLVFFGKLLGSGGSLAVQRLPLPLLDVENERTYALVLAVIFVLGALGVLELRRRAFGRRLVALNDSPAACATMGISVATTKLIVFTGSAALAGLGGALFGGLNGSVSPNDFLLLNSLVLLLLATLGGLYTVSGAMLAALFYASFPILQNRFPGLGQVNYLLTGLGALTLGRNRYGLVGVLSSALADLRPAAPQARPRREVARAAG